MAWIDTLQLPPFATDQPRFAIVISGITDVEAMRRDAEHLREATGAVAVLAFEERMHIVSSDDSQCLDVEPA